MLKIKGPLGLGFVLLALCAICFVCVSPAAITKSSVATQDPVAASCKTTSASALDLRSRSVHAAKARYAATIEVQCAGATPYSIGLDTETAAGSALVVRKLGGRSTATHYLLSLRSHPANTADITGSIGVLAETSAGAAQKHAILRRVTKEIAPASNYPDTVRVRVTY